MAVGSDNDMQIESLSVRKKRHCVMMSCIQSRRGISRDLSEQYHELGLIINYLSNTSTLPESPSKGQENSDRLVYKYIAELLSRVSSLCLIFNTASSIA